MLWSNQKTAATPRTPVPYSTCHIISSGAPSRLPEGAEAPAPCSTSCGSRKKGSHRRRKAVVLLRKIHQHIFNQRNDHQHKLGSHAGEPVRKDWGKKTPARRTHICQGCPFRPLLVRRTVSDESDTKEGKNSAYLSLRNLLPQPLLPLAGFGREVLPEIS